MAGKGAPGASTASHRVNASPPNWCSGSATEEAPAVAEAVVVQLKERDLELLVKFLGLLGSDQVGERAAAALKVHEWAVARGVSWREMLIPDEPEEVPVEVSVGKRTNGRAHFYGQQGP